MDSYQEIAKTMGWLLEGRGQGWRIGTYLGIAWEIWSEIGAEKLNKIQNYYKRGVDFNDYKAKKDSSDIYFKLIKTKRFDFLYNLVRNLMVW